MAKGGALKGPQGSPKVDDVKGVGPAPMPNDVTGNQGALQTEKSVPEK